MGFEPTIFGSGNRRLVHLATGTLSSQSIVGFQVFTRRRHERGRLLRTVGAFAGIAQLGERQTEDLKVAGSIPAAGINFFDYYFYLFYFLFILLNFIFTTLHLVFFLSPDNHCYLPMVVSGLCAQIHNHPPVTTKALVGQTLAKASRDQNLRSRKDMVFQFLVTSDFFFFFHNKKRSR